MLKNTLGKTLAFAAMLYVGASIAAIDVNKASVAELDGLKGIGPAVSGRILDERKKGEFKDWDDFISRVKGVGPSSAAKFSSEGLTVNGAAFKGSKPPQDSAKASITARSAAADKK